MKTLSTRTLSAYYITALLILAGLSIASHLVLDYVVRTNQGSAAVVNRSGRQRMLSQRIASMAAQYRLGDQDAREDLLSSATEFEAAHMALLPSVEPSTEDDEDTRRLRALYFAGSHPLDRDATQFITSARRFAALAPDDPAAAPLLADLFAISRHPLLDDLNEAVSIHQHESDRRMAQLEGLQWAILVIVLLTLLVEAFTIFRPMIRRVIVYTAEIVRLATIDTLTGAINRRSFFEAAATELARARRYRRPLGLMMLDADHFKRVNDTYGHAIGDEVLKALAAALKAGIRDSDILGRLGGEEFAIVLPETDLPQAAALAERLRKAVADLTVPGGQHGITFTVSIGVAPVPLEDGGIEQALALADLLLYRAKERGRDCVVVAEEKEWVRRPAGLRQGYATD
jgi:diguanylate cyclase (GGDEF)-like protein